MNLSVLINFILGGTFIVVMCALIMMILFISTLLVREFLKASKSMKRGDEHDAG